MKHMRRNVLLLALSQALMMSGNSLLIASAALIGYSLLGADKSLAALPLALQFLATLATSIPASLLMARIGRRAGFAAGSLLGALGGGIGTLAVHQHDFALFCTATMLIGVFNGFAIYYRFAAADGAEASYRGKAISYVLAGGVLAAFIGPNLAHLTRELWPVLWAGSMASLVVIHLTGFTLQLFLHIPRPAPQTLQGGRPLSIIVRQPRFLIAVCCAMLGYGVMSLVMTATPLAMQHLRLEFGDTAMVIQWHVFAMFAPSFFTGHLLQRFGCLKVMLAGVLLDFLCVGINLHGTSVWHFWSALVALGVGWNFLFIGGTTLLTETYAPSERAKTQAINDFFVFTATTLSAFSAGALQHRLGWDVVNLGVTPLLALILAAIAWLAITPPLRPPQSV